MNIELRGNGVVLPGKITRPAHPGPRPGIVVCPGGLAKGNIDELDWVAKRFAEAGFVAVTVSYRAAYPGDDNVDIGLGLDLLGNDPNVDPRRLALIGDSRGGMSALRTAALDRRVRAVVGLAPPCDMKHNVRGTMLYAPMRHKTQLEMMGGEPDEVPERYELVQAISYTDRIKQPVLLIHGTFDMHAPPEMSMYMERALRRAGNDKVELVLLEGLGHFWERQHQGCERDKVADIAVSWMVQNLN